jgi:uncharacterized spore protein YtfJ
MSEPSLSFDFERITDPGKAAEVMGKLADVADPARVFSAPVVVGEFTIITASEVGAGLGFGYGGGGGGDVRAEPDSKQANGFGMGGGGGGGSMARPVAVIAIGPDGVRVEPVVDVSKIALTLFTTIGGIALALGRMSRAGK